ncbi:MAG TPA: YqgE/AlgH family protein [Methylophilaceae bacterium]|jgi:putative transcriptional regulator
MENVNLTGHFLIAMPAMEDPRFAKSVTYICEHNADGAMGVVINHPLELTYRSVFSQLKIEIQDHPMADKPVYFGGPVQTERGFVLHQPPGDWDSTIAISGETALTTSKDILEAVANGTGPEKILLTLGYAGWSPGQLEEEMGQNAWLSVKASDAIIFDTPNNNKLNAAMGLLGLDFARLSDEAGHA